MNAPPNLPIFSGQEPVPSTEGCIDQWLFQVEGALATHTEEAVRSAVIGSIRGAAHELFRVHRLWGGDGTYIETHQRKIWTGTFQSKVAERIFPDGTEEDRKYKSICGKGGAEV